MACFCWSVKPAQGSAYPPQHPSLFAISYELRAHYEGVASALGNPGPSLVPGWLPPTWGGGFSAARTDTTAI
jgi:hypothetical protein